MELWDKTLYFLGLILLESSAAEGRLADVRGASLSFIVCCVDDEHSQFGVLVEEPIVV